MWYRILSYNVYTWTLCTYDIYFCIQPYTRVSNIHTYTALYIHILHIIIHYTLTLYTHSYYSLDDKSIVKMKIDSNSLFSGSFQHTLSKFVKMTLCTEVMYTVYIYVCISMLHVLCVYIWSDCMLYMRMFHYVYARNTYTLIFRICVQPRITLHISTLLMPMYIICV